MPSRSLTVPHVTLVLGGGGAKGAAHIGVLEVLEHAQVPIDTIVGCSVGALVGGFYADGRAVPELLDLMIATLPRRFSLRTFGWPRLLQGLRGGGFFTMERLRCLLYRQLRARTFEELKLPLCVVATDMHSGTLHTFQEGELLAPLCASSSIPWLFAPATVAGRTYHDGMLVAKLPVEVALRRVDTVVIASSVAHTPSLASGTELRNTTLRSYEIMQHHLNAPCEERAHVTIRPDLSGVASHLFATPEKVELMYQRGRKAAQEALPRVKELLSQYSAPHPKA